MNLKTINLVLIGLISVVGVLLLITIYGSNDRYEFANALFTGLAFVFLVVSIFLQNKSIKQNTDSLEMQREDLKLQRDELILTRKEMEEQTKTFEQANKLSREQAIEMTFFKLLSHSRELKQSMVDIGYHIDAIGKNSSVYEKKANLIFIETVDWYKKIIFRYNLEPVETYANCVDFVKKIKNEVRDSNKPNVFYDVEAYFQSLNYCLEYAEANFDKSKAVDYVCYIFISMSEREKILLYLILIIERDSVFTRYYDYCVGIEKLLKLYGFEALLNADLTIIKHV